MKSTLFSSFLLLCLLGIIVFTFIGCAGTTGNGSFTAENQKQWDAPRSEQCSHCDGTGVCPSYHGTGRVLGDVCPDCGGSGVCSTCHGTGVYKY